jgi:hypothetical protein
MGSEFAGCSVNGIKVLHEERMVLPALDSQNHLSDQRKRLKLRSKNKAARSRSLGDTFSSMRFRRSKLTESDAIVAAGQSSEDPNIHVGSNRSSRPIHQQEVSTT